MRSEFVLHGGDLADARWRRACVDRLVAAGLDPGRRSAVELAIHEAVCNALGHGHLGDAARPIGVRVDTAAATGMIVEVADGALGGTWSPPTPSPGSVAVPVTDRRGRGLVLMRAGCDELRITTAPDGTRVAMTFRRHPVGRMGANGRER
jgi:anti-sigma regulatory factor (Ser/Thr protein kinase)